MRSSYFSVFSVFGLSTEIYDHIETSKYIFTPHQINGFSMETDTVKKTPPCRDLHVNDIEKQQQE